VAEGARAGGRRRGECPGWARADAGPANRPGEASWRLGPTGPGAPCPGPCDWPTPRAPPPAHTAAASERRSDPRLLLNGTVSTFNSTSSQHNKGTLPIADQRPRASMKDCRSNPTGKGGRSASRVMDATCRGTRSPESKRNARWNHSESNRSTGGGPWAGPMRGAASARSVRQGDRAVARMAGETAQDGTMPGTPRKLGYGRTQRRYGGTRTSRPDTRPRMRIACAPYGRWAILLLAGLRHKP
jgi:hypothetical protein